MNSKAVDFDYDYIFNVNFYNKFLNNNYDIILFLILFHTKLYINNIFE